MADRKWTKDEIWKVLQTNDKQLIKAFKKLMEFQTADEKIDEETKYLNGVGFNGRDGGFAASLLRGYENYGSFTGRQMVALRKMMKKYSGQLAKIANGEITLENVNV